MQETPRLNLRAWFCPVDDAYLQAAGNPLTIAGRGEPSAQT